MELQSTVEFIRNVALDVVNGNIEQSDLMENLKTSLIADGFRKATHLRALAEMQSTSDPSFPVNLVAVLICILCAAVASGLTQGLVSLDFMEMTIKAKSGTPQERIDAAKVLPIISRHHLMLSSLMLWNAGAAEALPIFLHKLVPDWLAIMISVALVVFFGEILPSSIFTGPNQLSLAASLVPLVYVVLAIFYPFAYPMELMLDYFLGHNGMKMYNRKEISTMMVLQHEEGIKRGTHGAIDAVHHEEVAIISGALKFREVQVNAVMTPLKDMYMIPASEKLSYKTLYDIFKSGYSRIPVYDADQDDIIGLILAKDLIFVDAQDETPVRNFIQLFGRKPAVVWHDDKLGEALSMFRQTRSHMAIVRDVVSVGKGDPVYKVVGTITLEDIIEEILGTGVADETDSVASDTEPPVLFRDMDFIRLKLLHMKMCDDILGTDEVKGIVAHLTVNVPQIQHLFADNMTGLTDLIQRSPVLKMKRKAPEGALKPSQEDMLYRRGKMSSTCILILSGKITVLAGRDEFYSEKGPWSTLGADALTVEAGTYVPDFSAYISSESIRFVSISLHSHHSEQAGVENAGMNSHSPSKSVCVNKEDEKTDDVSRASSLDALIGDDGE